MALNLPPPPPAQDSILGKWPYMLWQRLLQAGSGSSGGVSSHPDLTQLNSANYYHLTQIEYGNLVYTADARLSNSRPASDVYAWAKAATKPTYTYSEVGAAPASGIAASAISGTAWTQSSLTNLSQLTNGPGFVTSAGSVANSTYATYTTQITSPNWTVLEVGGKLRFRYGGTDKASLDSSGNLIVTGNVTAYSTP